MVLISRPRQTPQERVEQRRRENPALDAMLNENLNNIHHFARLPAATLDVHEMLKKRWRDFASCQDKFPDLPSEIEPGIPKDSIPQGAIKYFLLHLGASIDGEFDSESKATVIQDLRTLVACLMRYASIHIPRPLVTHLVEFVQSEEVKALLTSIRAEPIASTHDLDASKRARSYSEDEAGNADQSTGKGKASSRKRARALAVRPILRE
ncbi:hypothetical protein B0H12DRAFT_786397 [Mycena haematopus]|nr:hypothetical protein B0H12DRAFT_786397 [Mycena haematopus]